MSDVYETFLSRFHSCEDMWQYQSLIRELGPLMTDPYRRSKVGNEVKKVWFPKKFVLTSDMVVTDKAVVVFPTASPPLTYKAIEPCNIDDDDGDTPVYLKNYGVGLYAFRFIFDMKTRDWLEDTPLST